MAARASILVLYFFYFLIMCSGVQLTKFRKQGPAPATDLNNSDFNKEVRNSIYQETLKTISDKLKKLKLDNDAAEKELATANNERLQADIEKVDKILSKLRERHRLNLENQEKAHSLEIKKYEDSLNQDKNDELKQFDDKLSQELDALNQEEEANRNSIKKEFAEKKKELEEKQKLESEDLSNKLDEMLNTILENENEKLKDFTQTSLEKMNSITDDYNQAEQSIAVSFGIAQSEIDKIKRVVSDYLFPIAAFNEEATANLATSTFSIDSSASTTQTQAAVATS